MDGEALWDQGALVEIILSKSISLNSKFNKVWLTVVEIETDSKSIISYIIYKAI